MAHFVFLVLLALAAAGFVGWRMFSPKSKDPLSKEEIISGAFSVALLIIGLLGIVESAGL